MKKMNIWERNIGDWGAPGLVQTDKPTTNIKANKHFSFSHSTSFLKSHLERRTSTEKMSTPAWLVVLPVLHSPNSLGISEGPDHC